MASAGRQSRFSTKSSISAPTSSRRNPHAERVVTDLFDHWTSHPEALPPSYREQTAREPVHRVVCDYLAGMTDSFILRKHEELCGSG